MTEPSNRQGSPSRDIHNNIDINNHRVRFDEGELRPDSTTYPPIARQEKLPQPAALPPPGPAVYWDDRDGDRDSVAFTANTAQLEQYTFYREPTPPPADYAIQERGSSRGAAASGPLAGASGFGGAENEGQLHNKAGNWSVSESNNAPSAAKRRLFWVIVLICVLMIVGVAVGVGVGVSLKKKSHAGSTEDDPALSSGASATSASIGGSSPAITAGIDSQSDTQVVTSTTTQATSAASTSFSAASRPNINSDCPAANNTIYQVPGSTQRFLRLCGVDYSGTGDARDLAQVYTDSMAECINACASFDQCTAVGWGYIAGDAGSAHRCFMKTDLRRSHAASRDWCFAILQQ